MAAPIDSVASRSVEVFSFRARSDSLSEMLSRVADGDEPAFAALYDATRQTVFGIVLRVLRDYAQAQEVCQEVYLTVWLLAGTFDPTRGTPSGWINAIAHRRAVDRVRHAERVRRRDHQHSQVLIDVAVADPAPIVLTQMEAHRHARRVQTALAQLSDAQRTTIVLAYFDGLTQQQIAHRLTVPLGTVKSRTREALRQLRFLLPERANL